MASRFDCAKQVVQAVVGVDTEVFLEQVAGDRFRLEMPAGAYWRRPEHPPIELEAPVHDLAPALRQALDLPPPH